MPSNSKRDYKSRVRREVRIEEAFRKTVQLAGRCLFCGYNRDPRVLEAHHIIGKKRGGPLVILCPTCHRELTLRQRPKMLEQHADSTISWLGFMLEGIGEVLIFCGKLLKEVSIQISDGKFDEK